MISVPGVVNLSHMKAPLSIWCNAHYPPAAMDQLARGVGGHRLLLSEVRHKSNLAAGEADPLLAQADIAFGQPDPQQIIELPRLRWVHLSTAGYTRYDSPAVRDALGKRGAILTNSSMVYDEPCAQHVLGMMLALSRQLPQCWVDQATSRGWEAAGHRIRCHLLEGQTVLILGFGAIARRLVQLLQPFGMDIMAIRRRVMGTEAVRTFPLSQLRELVPQADHVINLLPANDSTDRIFNADLLAAMRQTALFYNIGRGTTVDQFALLTALETHRIAGAYLDVTDPEPLPPEHPLWRVPNCWITPHTAGGHANEFQRLVAHFLENLRRFESGEALLDRIV